MFISDYKAPSNVYSGYCMLILKDQYQQYYNLWYTSSTYIYIYIYICTYIYIYKYTCNWWGIISMQVTKGNGGNSFRGAAFARPDKYKLYMVNWTAAYYLVRGLLRTYELWCKTYLFLLSYTTVSFLLSRIFNTIVLLEAKLRYNFISDIEKIGENTFHGSNLRKKTSTKCTLAHKNLNESPCRLHLARI